MGIVVNELSMMEEMLTKDVFNGRVDLDHLFNVWKY